MPIPPDSDHSFAVTLALEHAETLLGWCKAFLTDVDEGNTDPDFNDLRLALEALEVGIDEAQS